MRRCFYPLFFLFISLSAGFPVDPLPGFSSTLPVEAPVSSAPTLSLASIALAAAAFYALLSTRPTYVSDGSTYRMPESGETLYLPSADGWTEASFSSDADYLSYLRDVVSSSSGEVPVRNAAGNWVLTSKDSVSRYLSMLDSSRSRIASLQKEVEAAQASLRRAKRIAKTRGSTWRISGAVRYLDKVESNLASARSSFSQLSSWSSDLSAFDFDTEVGFKFSGKTYTFSLGVISKIDVHDADKRFRDKAEAAEKEFYSEVKSLFSGFSENIDSLGWAGVDLMKARMNELLEEYQEKIKLAGAEFNADRMGGSSWTKYYLNMSERRAEACDDMEEFFASYVSKVDSLAFEALVSAEEKARLKQETYLAEQREAERNRAFWDRNYDKIIDDIQEDQDKAYALMEALSGEALNSVVKTEDIGMLDLDRSYLQDSPDEMTYQDAVSQSFSNAFATVNFLESHSRSKQEFDDIFSGSYRSSVAGFDRTGYNASLVNKLASLMDSLNSSVAEGTLSGVRSRLDSLNELLSEFESSNSKAFSWFSDSIYAPWAENFNSAYDAAREARMEEIRLEQERIEREKQEYLDYLRVKRQEALDSWKLAWDTQEFGWEDYDLSDPNGMCSFLGLEVQAAEASTQDPDTIRIVISPFETPERRENGIVDNIVGLGIGLGEGAYDMVVGVGHLIHGTGETLWNGLHDPVGTAEEVYDMAAYIVTHLDEMAAAVIDPFLDDWNNGRPGEAIGRAIFELASLIGTGGIAAALKTGKLSLLGKVGKTSKVVTIANKTETIGSLVDDVARLSDNVAGVTDDVSRFDKTCSVLKTNLVEGESISGKTFLDALRTKGVDDFIPQKYHELLDDGGLRIEVRDLTDDVLAYYDAESNVITLSKEALDLGDDVAIAETRFSLAHELEHVSQRDRFFDECHKVFEDGDWYTLEDFRYKMAEMEYDAYKSEALLRKEADQLSDLDVFFDESGKLLDKDIIIQDYILLDKNYVTGFDAMYNAAKNGDFEAYLLK